jgi:hypothetical protein
LVLRERRYLRNFGKLIAQDTERWGNAVRFAGIKPEQAYRWLWYTCPRRVDFRGALVPLSGAGKVLKRELRAP